MTINTSSNPEQIADAILANQGRLLNAGLDAILEAIQDITELISMLMEKNKQAITGPARIANGARIDSLLKLLNALVEKMKVLNAEERAKRAESFIDDIMKKQTKGLGKS